MSGRTFYPKRVMVGHLGAVCIAIVWGWLLGLRFAPPRAGKLLLLAMGTVVLAVVVSWFRFPHQLWSGVCLSAIIAGTATVSLFAYRILVSLLQRSRERPCAAVRNVPWQIHRS